MNNMRKNVNQYFQDFIGNGIYDLIKFILGLFITTFVGSGIIFKVFNIFIKNKFLVIAMSGFAII